MHPDVFHKVIAKLTSSSSRKPLSVGDKVIVRNYHQTKVWLTAQIVKLQVQFLIRVKLHQT